MTPPGVAPAPSADFMSGCVGNYANSPLPVRSCSINTAQTCYNDVNCGATGGTCTGPLVPGTGIRKFMDPLPNIPVAVPDTITYPGSDYYEIHLIEYSQKLHTDLPPTLLRGYVQVNNGTDAAGANTIAPAAVQYLGPLIVAQKDRPVRIKFVNTLPTGVGGDLFIPVDTSVMGSGMAPDGTMYSQNRATLHLHGGNTPWISDGTPHQWTTPATEGTSYPKGVSTRDVPDMPPSGPGEMTFFYTNQQSARLMFYHDHAYGITRLNVYAGEAAGYLLTDPQEQSLVGSGAVPAEQIPLVIQDRTFIPTPDQLAAQDPTWNWGPKDANGDFQVGGLWFPHVYMPNQNPSDDSGANMMGRWDWGPWFWPPMDPSTLKQGEIPCPTGANPLQMCPGIPNPSLTPEAFMDTPVINGAAYPVLQVAPKAYRFRILNAANDRMINLGLYLADPTVTTLDGRTNTEVRTIIPPDGVAGQGPIPDPTTAGPAMIQIGTEGGFLPAPVTIPATPISYNYNRRDIVVLNIAGHGLFLGPAERADVIVDFSAYAGKTLILYNDAPAPVPAFDPRYDYYTGDPDQTMTGGAPSTIAGFGPNTRTMMQIQVAAGAPAPFDPTPLATALPVAYAASQPVPIVPEAAYGPAFKQTYANTYSRIQSTALTFTALNPDGSPKLDPVTNLPITITQPIERKAIQELFELQYGRMNATLGVELKFSNFNTQTTIPYGYVDPPTELMKDGAIQIWKITHNGVDTHAMHFHLFNVQLLNRVGWDGAVRPPEANELGWKETVRMNPLEDAIVAIMPMNQNLPWAVPDSVRLLDPSMPEGSTSTTMFTNIDPANNPFTVVNQTTNFGKEYVWHCHLLGHEENDMMRPIVFQVAPETPTNLAASGTTSIVLSWQDNSATETGFTVERDTDPLFSNPTTFPVGASAGQQNILGQGVDTGSVITYTDTTIGNVTCAVSPCTVYYRVQAFNGVALANAWSIPPVAQTLFSGFSNVVQIGLPPSASVSPTSLAFGDQLIGTPSLSQAVNVSNGGPGALLVTGVAITGANVGDFAQTNNCTGSIPSGGSCAINVTFTPVLIGGKGASLTITTNDPLNPTFTVPMTGNGIAPAFVLTPTSIAFGNQPVNTSSTATLVTVSNATGTAPLIINNIGVTGTNAADFAATNTCGGFPATVIAGGSCTVSVTFTPAAAGARSASLDFSVAAPANSQSISLTGTGTVPAVTLAPASLAFGTQLVTKPVTPGTAQTVTLTNTGLAPLAISSITIAGPNPADFTQTNTCPAILAAGAPCNISVQLAPTVRGARTAVLTITDNAAGSPQTVALSGTGIAPVAVVSLTPLNFGVQVIATTSAPQSVTLLNNGDAPLAISSILVSGDYARVANPSNCGTSLAPLANCTISVTFTPTTTGVRPGTLTIGSSDPANPTVAVPLNGTGTAVVLSPAAVAFAPQVIGTNSGPNTVTLNNVGAATLTINSISLTGANAGDFTMNNGCGGTLRPGRSCTVTVRFAPTATGARSASLTFNINDPVNPQAVLLSGTGVAPIATVTPGALVFSSSLNVVTAAQAVTVTNTGTSPLTINGIALGGTNPNQFAQTSNCPIGTATPLGAGASCTVNVTFNPTNATTLTKNAVLSLNVAAPATPQTVTLTGTIVVPVFTLTPGSLSFGNVARGSNSSKSVTVSNTGAAPLTINRINLNGAAPNQFSQTNNCGASLAVGASCTINVTFAPNSRGAKSATLNVNVAAPGTSQSVALTGTGL